MNERLPYEEQLAQQLNDLSLPDENRAWDDMKRRLEEDDDGGIIPIWLRGCGLWGFLAVVLIGIGWWLIRPEKWLTKKQEMETVKTIDQKENKDNNSSTKINTEDTTRRKNESEKILKGDGKEILTDNSFDSSLTTINDKSKKSLQKDDANLSVEIIDAGTTKKKESKQSQTIKSNSVKKKQPDNKDRGNQIETGQIDISIEPANKKKDTTSLVEVNTRLDFSNKDSASVTTIPAGKKDSVVKTNLVDSISIKTDVPIVKTNEPKKDSSKPKTISFSAGLGMHQLLPIAGQKLNPYNSAGRKGSFADYIPSVFGRMYIGDKWFLQAEFRYGAPQYNKEFVYKQQNVLDTVGFPVNNHTIVTSSSLKKTFYHQLPFTFNYFILPKWSIGTGVVWNKFASAVSQLEVNRKHNVTQGDSIISNVIIKDKNDTLFKKSYFQAIFETQYQWKRFSFGLKYSLGLQPYIRFTLPGGIRREERNKSLQIFLRYELWKSKAKR